MIVPKSNREFLNRPLDTSDVNARRGNRSPRDSALGVARDREKARGECLWGPGLMGGLAGGRVRSRNRRGIPKKKSCSLNFVSPALRVIQRQGEFDSKGLVKK